jgi:hypothetical protein
MNGHAVLSSIGFVMLKPGEEGETGQDHLSDRCAICRQLEFLCDINSHDPQFEAEFTGFFGSCLSITAKFVF